MNCNKFYGGRIVRYKFMCDALNHLEASTLEKEHDVVLLPPASGNKEIESDEEDIDDEALHRSNLPQESESLALQASIAEPPKARSEHAGKSEYEIFLLFRTLEIISYITEQTNLYARDKNDHKFMVTEEDICQFLGLILISSCHNVPSENDYWSTAEDMQAPIFSKTMSRDNFRTIKRYFHVAENQKLDNSKIAKISWLYSKLKKNLQQFSVFHKMLSVDEAMVPYYGHHSAKMFIKNKPVRFAFKIWMLCGSDRYPYNMDIYC
ncbi:hypothetical protein ILUMI_14710, partial [Ignelater luminosus]